MADENCSRSGSLVLDSKFSCDLRRTVQGKVALFVLSRLIGEFDSVEVTSNFIVGNDNEFKFFFDSRGNLKRAIQLGTPNIVIYEE